MMKREERAKQFAPFEALGGLREALREVELKHERIDKPEPSEESAQKISRELQKIERGVTVKLTYYEHGFCLKLQGEIESVDFVNRVLKIGNGKIFFEDILDLEVV